MGIYNELQRLHYFTFLSYIRSGRSSFPRNIFFQDSGSLKVCMSQDKQNCLPKAAGRQKASTAASVQGRGFGPLRGYPVIADSKGRGLPAKPLPPSHLPAGGASSQKPSWPAVSRVVTKSLLCPLRLPFSVSTAGLTPVYTVY